MRNTNHRISKSLVEKASCTHRGLAIEDLKGIRERTKVRKAQRARHSSWAFAQLREFLSYKAAKASVYLAVVDPRNTSRTCSECGHCEKANRQGETFCCRPCGNTADSDINGAKNIRAAVNLPNSLVANVAFVESSTHSYKPTALAVGS